MEKLLEFDREDLVIFYGASGVCYVGYATLFLCCCVLPLVEICENLNITGAFGQYSVHLELGLRLVLGSKLGLGLGLGSKLGLGLGLGFTQYLT